MGIAQIRSFCNKAKVILITNYASVQPLKIANLQCNPLATSV